MIGRLGRLALVMGVLLLVLTWLLVRAATPDPALHERTLDALHALNLHDASLQRDVLRARAGLLRNYDPLVGATDGLRAAALDLEAAGRAMTGIGGGIVARAARLGAEVAALEAVVEAFKSSNALLQNSLSYVTHASHRLGLLAAADGEEVAARVADLANAMLRLTSEPRGEAAGEVAAALDRLERLPGPPGLREELRLLAAHGRVVVGTLPAVDTALDRLLAAPIAERTRGIQERYLDQHARAESRAQLFRVLLYGAAVMLLAYLGHLFLRLRANARALETRLGLERALAEASARLINLPRGEVARAIEHGLGQLAGQLAADRAYVLLDGAEGGPGREVHVWSRGPEDQGDEVAAAIAARPEPGGLCRVPSVAALTAGGLRSALQARGVRSWLCLPLRDPARPMGFLVLEALHRERRWREADIALLRTAGEIFASALERERAEAEREALETRLRQAERMEAIGTLAGGIAHDFNNILGAMLGYAEMALALLPADSRARHHVREVMKAGQRAVGVVDQILTFSRRGARERRPVRMAAVVEEAIALLHVSLPATVAIRVRAAADDAVVAGDAAQLQQVVMNLATNAAQAMAGHGTLEVALDTVDLARETVLSHGTLAPGRYVRLTVRDTGHGMDPATLARVFEPFFTTKAAGAGTGLGLASVHGIVEDHGGAVHVRSRPGQGSTFAAYLARAEAAAEAGEAETPPLARGHGETVLLVDDERPLVLLGEEILAALGYEPVGFDSSAAALAAFRAAPGRFDLVLADEAMPGMTGSQLAAAVHQIRPELPVVLMTGYGGPVLRRHRRAADVREVLKKPLLARDIAESLARHLQPAA